MDVATSLRRLFLPFSIVFYPLLYFVDRQMGIALATSNRPTMAIYLEAIELAAVAAVVSLFGAVLLGWALERSHVASTRRLRLLLRPSNGTIAVFAALSLVFWAIVIALPPSALPPGWSDAIGVIFAWPLAALYVGMIVIGNTVTGEPPLVVQFAIVGIGVALSTVWLSFLSRWIAALAIPGDSGTVRN